MNLNNFTIWTPSSEQKNTPLDAAGVFIIGRYEERNSPQITFLFCAASDNMQTDAERIMTQEKIDGFEKTVVYLLRQMPSQSERSALLSKLVASGIPSR